MGFGPLLGGRGVGIGRCCITCTLQRTDRALCMCSAWLPWPTSKTWLHSVSERAHTDCGLLQLLPCTCAPPSSSATLLFESRDEQCQSQQTSLLTLSVRALLATALYYSQIYARVNRQARQMHQLGWLTVCPCHWPCGPLLKCSPTSNTFFDIAIRCSKV